MTDKTPPPDLQAHPPENAQTRPDGTPRVGKRSGFRTLTGYRAEEWREGYARMVLDLEQAHMNSNGVAHGGVIMTIADASMGHSATWCPVSGHARYTSTISLTTSFLEGPKLGTRIIAEGRLISIDNRVATCTSEVRDETGRLIATAQASFRYATGSERLEGVPRRPPRP